MTTIAYKNGILAGDKQTTHGKVSVRTRKVHKIGDWLVGGAGDTAHLHEMHEWIREGMDPKTLPAFQRDTGSCVEILMVDKAGKLFMLENSHVLYEVEQQFFAIGSGRDFALAAMHLGKSAPEAIEVAAQFDVNTGMGVDTVTLNQPLKAWREHRNSVLSYPGDAMAGRPYDILAAGSLLQRQQQQNHAPEPGNLVPARA